MHTWGLKLTSLTRDANKRCVSGRTARKLLRHDDLIKQWEHLEELLPSDGETENLGTELSSRSDLRHRRIHVRERLGNVDDGSPGNRSRDGVSDSPLLPVSECLSSL